MYKLNNTNQTYYQMSSYHKSKFPALPSHTLISLQCKSFMRGSINMDIYLGCIIQNNIIYIQNNV